jgi:hypothetical protein
VAGPCSVVRPPRSAALSVRPSPSQILFLQLHSQGAVGEKRLSLLGAWWGQALLRTWAWEPSPKLRLSPLLPSQLNFC